MKLYKQVQRNKDPYSRHMDFYETYGFIVKKRVDKFNDKIRVFKPIAQWSSGEFYADTGVSVYSLDESEWSYLSHITNLEEATKKDVKRVTEAIEKNIESRTREVLKLTKYHDYLVGNDGQRD